MRCAAWCCATLCCAALCCAVGYELVRRIAAPSPFPRGPRRRTRLPAGPTCWHHVSVLPALGPPLAHPGMPYLSPQARKWFKGPVRNVDAGHKTTTLAEAAMRGELDETDSAFGNEGGEGAPEKAAQEGSDSDAVEKQFVVA